VHAGASSAERPATAAAVAAATTPAAATAKQSSSSSAAAAAAAAKGETLWRLEERDAAARKLLAARFEQELRQRSSTVRVPQVLWDIAVPQLAQHLKIMMYGCAGSCEAYSACSEGDHVGQISQNFASEIHRNAAMLAAAEHYELLLEQSDDDEDSSDAASSELLAESSSSDAQQQQQQQQQQRVQAAAAVVAPAVLAAVALPVTPAIAAASKLADKQGAEAWALMQSDAPLRQLTIAKAAALLRRNRPEWLPERFWVAAVPAAAQRLEDVIYSIASSADEYYHNTLNKRLLDGCDMLLAT
jgi:hypothetical protein